MNEPASIQPSGHASLARAMISRFHVIAWLFGVALSLLLFVRDFVTSQRAHDLSINGSAIWGRDFVNVFTSGRFVIEDRLADLYDKQAYRAWQTGEFGWGIHDHMYSYPPVTLLYTPAFGALPYFWSLALWTTISLLLFGLAARPWLAREKLHESLALILPTTIVCVWAVAPAAPRRVASRAAARTAICTGENPRLLAGAPLSRISEPPVSPRFRNDLRLFARL